LSFLLNFYIYPSIQRFSKMSFDSLPARKSSPKSLPHRTMADARNNIPSPRGLPLIGNILDIQNEVPLHGIERLLDIYGPIIKLNLFGNERITVGSADLLEELCDEKRFWKTPSDGLASLKDKDKNSGLFTAPSEEDMDWQQAHRTLMPAFGPLSIQQMFDEMHDVASQLVLKWARMGPSYRIPVTSDFTRLTLDTIALCAMDYRFNSFYQDELHPFVQAMNGSLSASSDRLKLGSMLRKMMPWDKSAEKVQQDRLYMAQVAQELVKNRRDHPTEKRDLLNVSKQLCQWAKR
jgi:cytochrome P450/NADPH-cytochrome P450 reductase